MYQAAVAALLAISLALNLGLVYRIRLLRSQPKPTKDASDLMHDLTRRGGALVKVTVVDPEGLFMLSPRDLK